jgi:cobalamin biosynthesis protein CobT
VNLFKRRDEVEGVDSAVLILLDNSGSMEYPRDGSTRMQAAVPVVVALHAAATAAGASVAVDAFSMATTPVVGWGAPTAKLAGLIAKINPNYNTNDYMAVRLAGDKLLARPEQRKVLIVITDGNGDKERTAKHVAALERCGVTVIGIGILLDSEMTTVYPSSINVKNLQDLASASFKHIKVAMA